MKCVICNNTMKKTKILHKTQFGHKLENSSWISAYKCPCGAIEYDETQIREIDEILKLCSYDLNCESD